MWSTSFSRSQEPPDDAPSTPARLVLFVGAGVRPDATASEALGRDGVRTLWLADTGHALQAGRMACFDAVVLDGALAQGSTSVSLSRLRTALRCPVLVVAAVADEIDEILALELGADAFLAQPLAPRRLRAHLAALMRRPAPAVPRPAAAAQYIEAGGWVFDSEVGRLMRGSRQVPLTELQVCLMKCLLARPGQMVAKPVLVAALPQGSSLQARSVDVYIHRLRMRLREQAVEGLVIEAVRGRGWVLHLGTPEFAASAA